MTVRTEKPQGTKARLIIDFYYRDPTGRRKRYRRKSAAATRKAARDEEARRRDRAARFGTPLLENEATVIANTTFGAVVERYREVYMPANLKPTTKRGYDAVLDLILLPRFGDKPVSEVTGAALLEPSSRARSLASDDSTRRALATTCRSSAEAFAATRSRSASRSRSRWRCRSCVNLTQPSSTSPLMKRSTSSYAKRAQRISGASGSWHMLAFAPTKSVVFAVAT